MIEIGSKAPDFVLKDQNVKRSSRAKHVRLEIRVTTGLTIVVPGSYNTEELPDLLRKKSRWILDKLAECGKGQSAAVEKKLKSGDFILYLGRHLKVVEQHNPGKAVSVRLEKNRLLVNLRWSPKFGQVAKSGFCS